MKCYPPWKACRHRICWIKIVFSAGGGGEPSILPGFEDAAQWITKHGYWQNVHTNALIYSPAIGRMLRRDQGEINISLDSSSPEIYRNVKGINGFARVVDSLKKYVADARSPAQIVLKYIIYEKTTRYRKLRNSSKCAHLLASKKFSFHLISGKSMPIKLVNRLMLRRLSCPGRPGILASKRVLFISPGKLLKKSTILQWPIFHDFLLAIQKKIIYSISQLKYRFSIVGDVRLCA